MGQLPARPSDTTSATRHRRQSAYALGQPGGSSAHVPLLKTLKLHGASAQGGGSGRGRGTCCHGADSPPLQASTARRCKKTQPAVARKDSPPL